VTSGDVTGGPSAASFEVEIAPDSRHSSIHRRETPWHPSSFEPDDDVIDDMSDVGDEVVVKVVRNEAIKQGSSYATIGVLYLPWN